MEDVKAKNVFIAYEYLSLSIDNDMRSVYSDCYQNFGWEIDEFAVSENIEGTGTIKMKRNRRIENRAELNQLQINCEKALVHIYRLERLKNVKALIVTISIGLIGTILMACAVSAYLESFIVLCVLLAIPAFLGVIVPYFVYNRIKEKETNKINLQVDAAYDVLYKTCEEANLLILA